jgi:hypothetical protein
MDNPQRDLERATLAAFAVAFGASILSSSPGLRGALAGVPFAGPVSAGMAGLGLLYLIVGVKGGCGPPDFMAKFWPAVFAGLSGFLMVENVELPAWLGFLNLLLHALYVGVLAASVVRLALCLRAQPSNKLPNPATLGLPTADDASPQTAHACVTRSGGYRRPRFRTS